MKQLNKEIKFCTKKIAATRLLLATRPHSNKDIAAGLRYIHFFKDRLKTAQKAKYSQKIAI